MFRTTILLPEMLKEKIEREAAHEEVSFSEFVRRILQRYLVSKKNQFHQDTFLTSNTVFHDEGPSDVADRHDDYLIRRNPHGAS